jgi:hypothetical protein
MAHNVEYVVKGNKLVITMDIGPAMIASAPSSKTGKTNLVASTAGSVKVDGKDGLSFSVNLMQKADL